MLLRSLEIDSKLPVSEIVAKDYRTAEVFRRFGIGYCCGGKWPLDMACEMQGVDITKVIEELRFSTRNILVSSQVDFASWDIDFLMDYILNVHHQYLKKSLPVTQELLKEFSIEHIKKFTYLNDLEQKFGSLIKELMSSMKQEEEELFPYIRQVSHAHKGKEQYAVLLVRTLRKPVEKAMFKSQSIIIDIIRSIRQITNQYSTPQNACTSHKVVLARLNELDNDIMQHVYLEQSILFPRAITLEQEVLTNNQ